MRFFNIFKISMKFNQIQVLIETNLRCKACYKISDNFLEPKKLLDIKLSDTIKNLKYSYTL